MWSMVNRALNYFGRNNAMQIAPPGEGMIQPPLPWPLPGPFNSGNIAVTKFLSSEEAIKEISKLRSHIKERLAKVAPHEFLPAHAFLAALAGEIHTLKKLNDKSLRTPVGWDTSLNMPSPPTLIADAARCADFLEENNTLRVILKSFREWTLFCREEIKCGCGYRKINPNKTVKQEILIHHALKKEKLALIVKQFVCVRADDQYHMEWHYKDKEKKESRVLTGNNNIIWQAENNINRYGAFRETEVEVQNLRIQASETIYNPKELDNFEFGKRILEVVKQAEAI